MADININGGVLGNQLNALLLSSEIIPGDEVSYQLCKTLYAYHPLGAKLVDKPLKMMQSAKRKISVPKGPEERLVEAFEREWKAIGADKHILNVCRLARIYGIASIGVLSEGTPPDRPLDMKSLADANISFSGFDPLNTAGSLVLNQDPLSMDFLKVKDIAVQGQVFHRSRTVTLMHEDPIYIEYTGSAFGYVGRSIYQRALYPLKSFIQTMVTDDLVSLKAGVLIAKMSQQSSAIDQLMASAFAKKREMLKEAQTGNVISISTDEEIESLNLQNLEAPFATARKNIIENIASAAGEPALLILSETLAEGFGEGTEDAKLIAQHIETLREWAEPAYAWFTKIVQHRAWNKDFYKTIQNDYPERYGSVGYTQAFYDWTNSFVAQWPSLLEEPDSEKIKVNDVQLRAIVAMVEVLAPEVDPQNKAEVIRWACDNLNALKMLFPNPLNLDYEDLVNALEEQKENADALAQAGQPAGEEGVNKEPSPPKPFHDSDRRRAALQDLAGAVARLPALGERKLRK